MACYALPGVSRSLVCAPQCARHGLVSCLIDEGELAQVRTALDRFPDDRSTAFAMARALLEYIAWQVLREEDASGIVAVCAQSARAHTHTRLCAPRWPACSLARGSGAARSHGGQSVCSGVRGGAVSDH